MADAHLDPQAQFLFEQAELVGALESSPGFREEGIDQALDSEPLALSADDQRRGVAVSAVQRVGGAEQGEEDAEFSSAVARLEDAVAVGDRPAVIADEESDGAALCGGQGEGSVAKYELGAAGVVFGCAVTSCGVVDERADAEDSSLLRAQAVLRREEIEHAEGDGGDAALVGGEAEATEQSPAGGV